MLEVAEQYFTMEQEFEETFDENLWSSLVDHVTVMKDKKVVFPFKGGTEITV